MTDDVQFNLEDKGFNAPTYRDTTKKSKMIQLVMKTGLVKSEAQANYILLGLAGVFFLIMTMIISDTNKTVKVVVAPLQKSEIPESIIEQLPPEDIAQIPDPFYREDIPESVLRKLSSDIVNKIPSRSN